MSRVNFISLKNRAHSQKTITQKIRTIINFFNEKKMISLISNDFFQNNEM